MGNHREKPSIDAKLQSFMAEINRIKNPFISAGQKIPDDVKQEIEELRGYIKTLEEIKRIELKSKKDNRN